MPRPPAKAGTPKAVPVVVSAGLAIGVFCGLLFGLGTGDKAEAKGPSRGNNLKHTDESNTGTDPGAAPAGLGATTTTPKGGGPGSDIGKPVTVVVAGSDAGSAGSAAAASGSGGIGSGAAAMAGSATPAAPKGVKLTIDIDPDTAAQVAVITIDGKAVDGKTAELADGTKTVHLQISATGYHSIDEKLDIPAGDDADVKLKMQKKAVAASGGSPGFGGASSGGNHVPSRPPSTPKPPQTKPKGGIIDI